MHRITKTLGIIAILVLLPGVAQADDWPMFHHDPAHTGYTTESISDDLELLWSYQTGNCVDSSPAVANGKVFVGSRDEKIYCLDEDTGNLFWSYKTGGNVVSSPAVANGKVFVGSGDGKIYCLDENTGELVWSYKTGGSGDSSPAVANGKVFVGSYDNKIYCLDENNGKLIWSYETGSGVFSSPAVADGKVFVGSDDNKIYCLDENNGKLIWSSEIGYGVVSSPTVTNDKVFVGSLDFKIYCLDENNGKLIWSYDTGSEVNSLPAVANDKVFVGSLDFKIYCLDENNGDLIWSYETGNQVGSSPAVANDKVFVGSYDNKIYCLDENTGKLIWSYETGGGHSSPAVANGKIFVGSRDNRIYCFGVKTKLPATVPPAVPTVPPVTSTPTPTSTPSPFASIPPLYLIGAAAIIVIILIAGISISRKRKKGESAKPPAEPPKPETEPVKEKPIIKKETSPPISVPITIERTIYDPCKRDFIEGRLPRMKEWINRYDPSAYWFAVSIQNNTDRAIEEWGVELETSSALKVEAVKIEGIDYKIELRETYPEPYKNKYAIGVPKEYGIVIPKGGAQRIYFKLRAEKPKTTYEISGVFKSAITGDVPIRAKEFKYLCDTGVSPEAVKAELKKTFSEKDAARLALSFKTVQQIDRMCDKEAKTEEYLDKLSSLQGYTEGFSENFTNQLDDFSRFMKQEQLEYLDDAYKGKVRRFCTNLVDVWINEFLRG